MGHDAFQNDSNARPTVNSNGINNLPSIHFDGSGYFHAPSIFPANHDYTVAGVLRLDDTTVINNIISGDTHAIWFNSTSHLQVHHFWFQLDAIASAPVRPGGSRFVAIYNAANSTVRIYLDGRLSDSLWIHNNDDSTLFIGAYVGGYCLHGDLSELVLYNRDLDSTEEAQLDSYLGIKYALPERSTPPLPDTTFTQIPSHCQFFPRAADDSGRFTVSGKLHASGFDSIYMEILRNGQLQYRRSKPLAYSSGSAAFSFNGAIHAELSEFTVVVGAARNDVDSVLRRADSLVCGDAFLESGQSNALFGFNMPTEPNEFCRTFGVVYNHNTKDTLWSIAQSTGIGFGNCICAWAFQISQLLIDSLQIPICFISGATPGGYIEEHLRNDSNPLDMSTAYGDLLYKVQKANLDHAVKAMIWDQGEWNTDYNYYNNFVKLHNAWLQDYPSLQKVYVVQIRPNACNGGNQLRLKEIQRHFQDSLANVVGHASAAIPYNNSCHFEDSGYEIFGTELFHLILRDIYRGTDTINITSPNVREAFYTSPSHQQIELVFDPPNCSLTTTPDTVIGGKLRRMVDYLYLNDSAGKVQSIQVEGNKLLLSVTDPSANTITYLPDQDYSDTSEVYEGPWIITGRGVGAFIWYDLPISWTPLAASPMKSVTNFTLAPNPSYGSVTADASALIGSVQATLISETGAVVWQRTLLPDHPARVTFNFSAEPSGIYVLQLRNGNTIAEHKFILER